MLYDCVEKYHRLENEKKNARIIRKPHPGPMIKYQSFTIDEMVWDDQIDVEKTNGETTKTNEAKKFVCKFKVF